MTKPLPRKIDLRFPEDLRQPLADLLQGSRVSHYIIDLIRADLKERVR